MSFWSKKEKRIYADAGAATPLSLAAKNEILRLLDLFGNAGALHKEAVGAKNELESARKVIAESIGAHPDEIIFTASGTEGNNLAIQGVFKNGHGITCTIEHQSVLEPMRHRGLPITELSVDSEGLVDVKKFEEAIRPDTTFVSIQLVNSEIGTIEPVREIAKVLRKQNRKVYFHTDASQAPLWVDIKVEKLGIDLMTLDAQKVLGPKGVGALYVKRGTPIEPQLRGGKQERGLRGGTENVPLIGSFAVALKAAGEAVEERSARVTTLRDELWAEIKGLLPDATLNGPKGEGRVANNINVSIPGLDAQMAVVAMDAEGVAVSTRSACNIGDDEPSHVIVALGTPKNLAGTAIRITLLPDITSPEVKTIAKTLAEVAKRYRNVV